MDASHGGRIAVVTGAGGGLGREVALQLAARGATVACGDVSDEGCAETVEQVRSRGGRAEGFRVDVGSEESVKRWRDAVHERLGHVSIVVTCAGILVRDPLRDVDLELFLRVQRINLGGTYATIRTFLPDLTDAGWGRIVTVGSIAAVTGYPYASYGASKAAVVNLTRSLLLDLWGTGVTINTVCPGAIDTPMLHHTVGEQMRAKTPSARIATPAEIADVIDFFCKDSSASINGSALVVDGGATAQFRFFEE